MSGRSFRAEQAPAGFWRVVAEGFSQTQVDQTLARMHADFYTQIEALGYRVEKDVPITPGWVEEFAARVRYE